MRVLADYADWTTLALHTMRALARSAVRLEALEATGDPAEVRREARTYALLDARRRCGGAAMRRMRRAAGAC
jgi:hypothetical protein